MLGTVLPLYNADVGVHRVDLVIAKPPYNRGTSNRSNEKRTSVGAMIPTVLYQKLPCNEGCYKEVALY